MVLNNDKSENKEYSIWLGDDGIVRIKIGEVMNEMVVEKLIKDVREISEKSSTKLNLLIDLGFKVKTYSSLIRKRIIELMKVAFKELKFGKVVIYGGGTLQRITASFIISTSNLKNIKYLKTEEEALKWFKEK